MVNMNIQDKIDKFIDEKSCDGTGKKKRKRKGKEENIEESIKNKTAIEKDVLEFVGKQLGIYTRTNGLKTKEDIADAMKNNMAKWVKMFLVIKSK
jgi:hypothetical protein